jgi:hypothetical protein
LKKAGNVHFEKNMVSQEKAMELERVKNFLEEIKAM